MADFILTELAAVDIEEIYNYTAPENQSGAEHLLGSLFASFETLAHMPNIGHKRPDLTPHEVLFWPVSRFLVVYTMQKHNVAILRVLGASMDVSSILKPL